VASPRASGVNRATEEYATGDTRSSHRRRRCSDSRSAQSAQAPRYSLTRDRSQQKRRQLASFVPPRVSRRYPRAPRCIMAAVELRSRLRARLALCVFIPPCRLASQPNTRSSDGTGAGDRVEETVATATLMMIGQAAFHAAVEQYPGASLTLLQGARGILKSPE
jgi:hypothetical protein